MRTHSSLSTSDKYGDADGDGEPGWSMECRVCHDPHQQKQFRAYESESYLYSGISTDVTSTTITQTGAGWIVDAYKDLIVVPNISQAKYNYKILSNTSDTLTVQGPIDLTRVSAGDTFVIIYGKLIKSTITTPNSGNKQVKFFRNTGTKSFADGDTVYDGVCEVCHTQTTHFRNNGTGSDQLHANVGLPAGTNCIDCHSHINGFAHAAGGGGATCESCHGHDAGYEYEPGKYSQGKGTFKSHSTHTENDADDLKGPYITCNDCHNTNNFPYFKSGTDNNGDGKYDLSETDVCDTCHSPGGTYDGVNDPAIGAKNNWQNGVYSDSSLASGKEKWCAGCHDESPSVIQGVNAPNVIGDEDAQYPYGTGWGYYKTGHGLASGYYPATGAPAANKECLDCHDSTTAHIDGDARTYSAASNNYQAGYRLRDVNGGPPMDIPRASQDSDDFPLCFDCHNPGPFLSQTDYATNFRDDSASRNDHYMHLLGARPDNDWDSDWDCDPADPFGDDCSSFRDSRISCPACHNVHGSPSPAMIRHGELISTPGTADKVPSIDFQYTPEGTYPALTDSTGGKTRFIAPGPGTIEKNGICNMCHNDSVSYTRTPVDIYPPRITSVYGQIGSDTLTVSFSKGVYSDVGAVGDLTPEDFTLTDIDNNRTIIDVIHTAGDSLATLILSFPLDSVDDIGTDTLSAASSLSIYDASDNPMDTTPVIISGDTEAPSISNQNPANGATDVAVDSELTFTLSDSGIGIDWSTFSIQISGDKGYSKTYTDADTSVVSKTGAPLSYDVTVNPDANFGSGEIITVTVNVDDLAGNSLVPPAWSFTTATAPIWQTPDSVHDFQYLGSPGNLIDNNLNTGNGFGAGGPDHYVTFKLDAGGAPYTVTDVRLYGSPSYTSTWKLYVSTDGTNFTQIGSWSVGGASQWYEYTLSTPVTASYIRINDWHGGPESANVVFEFSFKGTP
jgi:hypothetical protein